MVRERLKVENITERYRKARLRWFGHGQGETEGREHHREVQKSKTEVVWTMVRERLKVENITERYSKARLRWFGHGQGETEGREHHREVQ